MSRSIFWIGSGLLLVTLISIESYINKCSVKNSCLHIGRKRYKEINLPLHSREGEILPLGLKYLYI